MWFATWLGIVEYDGKIFINHTLKEDLIHFHVFSLFEDSRGNLWFGMPRGGLYRLDAATTPNTSRKTFTLFTKNDGLVDNTVTSMTEDKKGNLWFGTEYGISRYDGKTFTNYTTKDHLAGNHINAVIADSSGKIWMGTNDGISIYDPSQNKDSISFSDFTYESGLPIQKVASLLEDHTGKIWIGKFDGLTIYDPAAASKSGQKSFTDYLSNFLTYYLISDKAGNVWFTHSEPNTIDPNLPNQVLYKYDASIGLHSGDKAFTKVLEKNGPNDFQIFGKTIDQDGNLWFSTMHGPCRYSGKTLTYFMKKG